MLFCRRNLAHAEEKITFASTCTRPDTSFDSAQLSQVISTSVERKKVANINKTIRKLNDLAHIVYLPLDLPSTYIVGYADAAFANNADNASQLGYIALLKDKKRPRSHHSLRLLEMSACYPIRAWRRNSRFLSLPWFCTSFIPRPFSNTPAESVGSHIYGL